MKRASLASAAVLAAVLASPTPARANGRFPEANQLAFAAHDPDLVLLRVTFGLLISHDRGKTFDWVCEQSIGVSGNEDPMYAVTPSNTYMGTTFQGLAITRDRACGWSFAPGELASQVFIDLTSNPNDAKNVVVFASSYDQQDDAGNIIFTSKIWETKDEGQSFQQLGPKLDPALLGYTIDLTATDPNRLYVTAVRDPGPRAKGFLLTSKNRGATWEEMEVPLEGTERAVFVAAVDPTNAERVYLRTSNGVDQPSRLLLRDLPNDSGVPTLRTLHIGQGALLGFALSPDGSKVYIGGPKDGVKVASTTDFAFEQQSTLEVQCLALNADGLWACSNERSGFIAGLSKDDGVTFESRLRFCGIRGPLTCDQGTPTNDRCSSLWPQQKSLIGCGDETAPDASADGSFGGEGGFAALPSSSKGCDCRTSASEQPWGALITVVGAAIALLRRRRNDDRSS